MGIFSHFRKKGRQPLPDEDHLSVDSRRAGDTLDPLADPSTIQRDIARATALKIDAIESEMTLEFVNTTHPGPSGAGATTTTTTATATALPAAGAARDQALLPEFAATVPLVCEPPSVAVPAAAPTAIPAAPEPLPELPSTPSLEEAAILFASNQPAVAQQILEEALQDPALGPATELAWNMLFDLHQLTGQREAFDALSIAYAAAFETSPPAWRATPALAALQDTSAGADSSKPAATPNVAFSGVLDAQITKQLARAQKLAESHTQLRLEFSRVTTVDPIGCGLLLRVLKKLQKSGLELILVGAPGLADKIRSILMVGRRDETEAPWLLLLEILQLLNREPEFEEASIDYCITFEVSPPAFVAPQTKVSTAAEEHPAGMTEAEADAFLMPVLIEGDTQPLIEAIAAHAGRHQAALLDCQHLARIEFGAAGQLLSGFSTLRAKVLELHNVNHLVIALLQTLGLQHSARILPRKN